MRGIAIACLILVGCSGSNEPLAVDPKARQTYAPPSVEVMAGTELRVADIGFTLFDEQISVAAVLEPVSKRFLSDVRIDLRFYAADGSEIAQVEENIPYCPAEERCWWATIYPGDQLAPDWRDITQVRIVGVTGDPEKSRGRDVLRVEIRRSKRGVRGEAPLQEGLVFVIALNGGTPVAGMSVNISAENDLPANFRIPSLLFPSTGGREELRAFMYRTRFAGGH